MQFYSAVLSCPAYTTPPGDGSLSCKNDLGHGNDEYGSVCTFSCDAGFGLSDDYPAEQRCDVNANADGGWEDTSDNTAAGGTPTCVGKYLRHKSSNNCL